MFNATTITDKKEVMLTCAEYFNLGPSSEAANTELRELYAAVHVDRLARSIFPLILDVFDRICVCNRHSQTWCTKARLTTASSTFTNMLYAFNVIPIKYTIKRFETNIKTSCNYYVRQQLC